MGAGSPKFRIWLTISAGRERKRHAQETPAAAAGASHARNRPSGGGPALRQTIMSASDGADGRRIAVGEIDAAVGQADVVDDVADLLGRDLPRMRLLHQIAKRAVSSMRVPVRARTCNLNWPASTAGKKSWPSNGTSSATETAHSHRKPSRKMRRWCRQRSSHRMVALAETFEALLESNLHANQRIAASAGRMASLRLRARAAGTSPWWEPASAKADTKPAWRTPPLPPAAQTDSALRR